MDRVQRSIVVRARAGEAEAFRQLFETYQGGLYNLFIYGKWFARRSWRRT